ncbi:MAG: glycosyltransferase involved in cell wall biosynthesis [Pseudohongiellaceae bacterium]|jgi:glycosyltransferase involved in cell wall biosynthesis
MKIAFVVHQYPPLYSTGTELYAHRMALALTRSGHDIRVFTNEPDPRQSISYRLVDEPADGVPVTRLTFFNGLVPNNALGDYYNVFLGKVFGRWLDEVKPDVVHVFHLMGIGLSAIEECKARGIPVYVQLMDYWFLCPTVQFLRHEGALCTGPEIAECIQCLAPENYGYQTLRVFGKNKGFVETARPEPSLTDVNHSDLGLRRAALAERPEFIRRILSTADGLIAPSLFIRSMFLSHGYPEELLLHMPYGVDPAPGDVRPVPVGGRDQVTFGFFGSVNAQKGLEILVSAFRECRGDRLGLVVRGNMSHFPKYAARVRGLAETDPRVIFKGPYAHGELSDALSAIDVLVVPSVWYENTPFVVLEAFCAGRPVIASDLGGLSELVQDGVNGRTFRAGDPAALLSVLSDFQNDPELLLKLSGGISRVPTLEGNAADFVHLWEGAKTSVGENS